MLFILTITLTMTMFDPQSPVNNTLIVYIIIICALLILKPTFMFDDKTNKFKCFGFEKNKTFLSFPIVCIGSAIMIYLFFLMVEIFNKTITN